MDSLQLLKIKQLDIFESMANIMTAMSAPVRIRIIHFLSQAPLTVDTLATKLDQSVANTSMHLRKMLQERLVTVEVMGQKRLYTLSSAVLNFWESFQDFSQELDPTIKMDTEKVYGEINWEENWKETIRLIKRNEIILLDVRPDDEVVQESLSFEVLHIPQQSLKQHLSKLPKRKKILVFCRGRMCALSSYTVNYLRENGFKAYRLESSWTRLKQELQH